VEGEITSVCRHNDEPSDSIKQVYIQWQVTRIALDMKFGKNDKAAGRYAILGLLSGGHVALCLFSVPRVQGLPSTVSGAD
jgi:hypothetical protein